MHKHLIISYCPCELTAEKAFIKYVLFFLQKATADALRNSKAKLQVSQYFIVSLHR